jgi:RNAse (barnase) inhibitor barstar
LQKVHLDDFSIPKNTLVTFKEMGHVYEICFQDKINNQILIKKLNDNEYVYLPTGEILQCNHIKNRSQSLFQIGQSLKRLRDYINTNVEEPLNCKWITLTYKDNMRDTKRLYKDFEKFIKRFKYNFKEYKIEYIVAMEPQRSWCMALSLNIDF